MAECAGRVLVVEDERTIANAVAQALADEGFDAQVADGLEAARRIIAEELPLAVILDLDLPDGAGELLLRDLARRAATPAVVMSATEYAPRVAARWAIPLVRKPFDLDELLTAVHVAREQALAPVAARPSLW